MSEVFAGWLGGEVDYMSDCRVVANVNKGENSLQALLSLLELVFRF